MPRYINIVDVIASARLVKEKGLDQSFWTAQGQDVTATDREPD
jgi:hypothetical protein